MKKTRYQTLVISKVLNEQLQYYQSTTIGITHASAPAIQTVEDREKISELGIMDKSHDQCIEVTAVENRLKCSFCGKNQDQVAKLVAGPGVYVCNECIDLCNEIMDEEGIQQRKGTDVGRLESLEPVPADKSARLKDAPIGLLETTIDSLEELITNYCDSGSRVDAEPLYRTQLLLQESAYGSKNTKLLPTLQKLLEIYRGRLQYGNCLAIIDWMRTILTETNAPADQLQELNVLTTRMYIKLGNKINAERWLDKILKSDASANADTST